MFMWKMRRIEFYAAKMFACNRLKTVGWDKKSTIVRRMKRMGQSFDRNNTISYNRMQEGNVWNHRQAF